MKEIEAFFERNKEGSYYAYEFIADGSSKYPDYHGTGISMGFEHMESAFVNALGFFRKTDNPKVKLNFSRLSSNPPGLCELEPGEKSRLRVLLKNYEGEAISA